MMISGNRSIATDGPVKEKKKPWYQDIAVAGVTGALAASLTAGISLLFGAPSAMKDYLDNRFAEIELATEKNRVAVMRNADIINEVFQDNSDSIRRLNSRMERVEEKLDKLSAIVGPSPSKGREHDVILHHTFRLEELEKDLMDLRTRGIRRENPRAVDWIDLQ